MKAFTDFPSCQIMSNKNHKPMSLLFMNATEGKANGPTAYSYAPLIAYMVTTASASLYVVWCVCVCEGALSANRGIN